MIQRDSKPTLKRRKFLQLSAAATGLMGLMGAGGCATKPAVEGESGSRDLVKRDAHRQFNGRYAGSELAQVAFPMGGMGAGMVCLEGTGALSHFSLRHRPEIFNEPQVFAGLFVKGATPFARVLEGPVPERKKFGSPGSGLGSVGATYGLPRFREASFQARFPFGRVRLQDAALPWEVEITGWSPFEPGDADNASLPVAALEYRFQNHSRQTQDAVFSWNAANFMRMGNNAFATKAAANGFILWAGAPKERDWEEGAFCVTVDDPATKVNHVWFRGDWFDSLTMAWRDVEQGNSSSLPPETGGWPSSGGSLFVPFTLRPGESKTIVVRFAWYVGKTNLRCGRDPEGTKQPLEYYQPWYGARFDSVEAVTSYWRDHYDSLRQKSKRFSDCFYQSTLPPEVMEAVAANLTILKSPVVLRQADGRLWGWEGCGDYDGSCEGSCTHVWNYAQAFAHLFPSLERTLRETEFGPSQDERGHQQFRSALPIRPAVHDFHAAADGQLGGIMKVYRDWRISGDTEWLRRLWPRVRKSLDYCIRTWDPRHRGWLEEPHHNTYDIEFWGPDGMCTSFYVGALTAAVIMGTALGDDVSAYDELRAKGVARMEGELFNGEYFIQKVQWTGLTVKNPLENPGGLSPEELARFKSEGPKYQYGHGCLSDGVLGAWLARVCGVGEIADSKKVASHLQAVYKYNLKHDLTDYPNPQRPGYACGAEGGLLLCSWPRGAALSLPFVYSNEVWTGIEYQVASHLMLTGQVNSGVEIVRTLRHRYDGGVRNPFDEYECGHWYARAMASYALLQGLSGARYDAVDQVLHLAPSIPGDFRCFLATASGYGLAGVKNGRPFYEPAAGSVEIREIKYEPCIRT